jgi:hypothetical protein
MKFNEEILSGVDHKPAKYFGVGNHTVKIGLIAGGTTEAGKEYVEFTIFDEEDNDREGTARLWFSSEKAAKYSVSIISGIFVHNTKEEKREVLKTALKKLTDTDALLEIAQKKLIGKEAFYVVEEDPIRTYTNKDGDTMPSVNRNIYGYQKDAPKEKVDTSTNKEIMGGGEEVAEFPDI